MRWIHTLSWLWKALGISLAVTAACVVCVLLISRARRKPLSRRFMAAVGVAAFVMVILIIILIARTPVPL